jgi:hypothetical protein
MRYSRPGGSLGASNVATPSVPGNPAPVEFGPHHRRKAAFQGQTRLGDPSTAESGETCQEAGAVRLRQRFEIEALRSRQVADQRRSFSKKPGAPCRSKSPTQPARRFRHRSIFEDPAPTTDLRAAGNVRIGRIVLKKAAVGPSAVAAVASWPAPSGHCGGLLWDQLGEFAEVLGCGGEEVQRTNR